MLGATIVARSRLPDARVLGSSFLRHHPGASFAVLVLDATGAADPVDGLEMLAPTDLELDPGLWDRLATGWGADDLTSGLKPLLLAHLLKRGDDAGHEKPGVMVLEPGMQIFAELNEAIVCARRHGVAMVPRVLDPLPDDGNRPSEQDLAAVGPLNDRFICVGPEGTEFLARWTARVGSPAWGGRSADQTWLGWAPLNGAAHVMRDAGYGVGGWNLHERPLRRNQKGTLLAGGRALRLMDLDGYDPRAPWRLTGDPAAGSRVSMDETPVLAELLDSYAAALRRARAGRTVPEDGLKYAANGLRLTPLVRRAYRRGWAEALRDHSRPPASAIDEHSRRAFTEWLATPVMGPAHLRLGPLERELWHERPDLRRRFPDPAGEDAGAYRAWLDGNSAFEGLLRDLIPTHPAPEATAPAQLPDAEVPANDDLARFGWNVVGHLSGDSDAGEAARRMAAAFERAAILTHRVNVPAVADRMTEPISDEAEMANSLYCVGPDELARTVALSTPPGHPRRSDPSARRIGMWFWELSRSPAGGIVLPEVDEIWCPSRFVADAITAHVQVPVKVIPVPASTAAGETQLTRQALGLPDGFVYLCSFDAGEVLARTNPVGVIDAYRAAFGPDDGASLVVRAANGRDFPERVAQVRWATRGRPDIHLIDGSADPTGGRPMIELSDCFVSLHRAEAAGLNLATAMAFARPVIATAYSGSLDFMDARSAYLVPYALRPVGDDNAPYPATAVWAEPDLDAAARLLRSVFEDPEQAAIVGMRGAQRVQRTHSLWQSATAIARELGFALPRKLNPNS